MLPFIIIFIKQKNFLIEKIKSVLKCVGSSNVKLVDYIYIMSLQTICPTSSSDDRENLSILTFFCVFPLQNHHIIMIFLIELNNRKKSNRKTFLQTNVIKNNNHTRYFSHLFPDRSDYSNFVNAYDNDIK